MSELATVGVRGRDGLAPGRRAAVAPVRALPQELRRARRTARSLRLRVCASWDGGIAGFRRRLAAIHDPPPGALRARCGIARAARPAKRRDRRRARLLVLRHRCGARVRARARRGRRAGRLGSRPRRRRCGASRRARRGRHGRGARVRHRPRLPARAQRSRSLDRRARSDPLRVRAGRRAGALALSRPATASSPA